MVALDAIDNGGWAWRRFYDRLGEPGMLKRLAARASIVVYASRRFWEASCVDTS